MHITAQGNIISRRDFVPFGEELYPDAVYRKSSDKYGTADSVRQKFTGYQRNEETGLDFAETRYGLDYAQVRDYTSGARYAFRRIRLATEKFSD